MMNEIKANIRQHRLGAESRGAREPRDSSIRESERIQASNTMQSTKQLILILSFILGAAIVGCDRASYAGGDHDDSRHSVIIASTSAVTAFGLQAFRTRERPGIFEQADAGHW